MTLYIGIGRSRSAGPATHRDDADAQSRRVSRWAVVAYVVVTLATPLLLYAGPDVLSPAAPAIAEAARGGELPIHPHATHAAAAVDAP
jgi:hypothetical protein